MTFPGEPARPLSTLEESAHGPGRRRDGAAVLEVCPFLAADAGAWRSAYAAREHRCEAVAPPSPLAIAKQRQLCLVAAHATCATYLAARAVMVDAARHEPEQGAVALWPATASTPLVLEPARRVGSLPTATARTGSQALLVGLMAVAFLVLVIARTQAPVAFGGATADPSVAGGIPGVEATSSTLPGGGPSEPPPSGSADASPSAPGGVVPNASPSEAPSTPVQATARPAATPTAASRSHRVRSGDTLGTIAARYGTTVRVLTRLNGIGDPRLIKIGQVLLIP